MNERRRALLLLEDATTFPGLAFGHVGERSGEAVFNTSMTGYQEILSDPSYRGQLVTLTSVHVGNYGINANDMESDRVQVAGLVVRSASRRASNFRATRTLEAWLCEHEIPGIMGVDTRAVTRHLRDRGAMMGMIVPDAAPDDIHAALERLKNVPRYEERDYVAECSVPAPRRVLLEETADPYVPLRVTLVGEETPWPERLLELPEVGVLDFGVKYSILRLLAESGFRVTVFPHDTAPETLLARELSGLLLSNGPGDPGRLGGAVERVRSLVGKVPIFGICLGHQILAQAVGGRTFKLKFGHRGPNQPVRVEATGRVQITSQNHGYTVELGETAQINERVEPVEVTHVNLNDRTVEGFALPTLRAFGLQHHPEAGPGPHDASEAFLDFRKVVMASRVL
ncbi:MAG: carbamoyl-phosphate synthase small subunit [Deltaproteobacteria bacterium]|nr:MAG: carbamoyl-phosphate synthase small subunit [Deltaproteobacteria bacterium]